MNRRLFNQTLGSIGLLGGLKKFDFEFFAKRPQPIFSGQTVGLICPGSPINDEKLNLAIENMKMLGLKPIYTENVKLKKGYLAGNDTDRLSDIHKMYLDNQVDMIWCIRGGYGCTRILDRINFSLIKNNPKPLIGYSDVTALLNAIYQETKSPCYHGPVAASEITSYTSSLLSVVANNESLKISAYAEHLSTQYTINGGSAEGGLVGGNLSLLAAMHGTPFEIKTKNKIVFMEDIGEKPYRIDRMLTQLISGGFFNKVRGIILGQFVDCDSEEDSSLTLKEVIRDRIAPLKIPSVYGFSIGHLDNQCTLPIGRKAVFDATQQILTLI